MDGGAPNSDETNGQRLYVIATTVWGPESDVTYLLTVPSLDADVEPDYRNAVALDGFAALYGENGSEAVYVGSGEAPEITEWTFDENGALQQGRVVSFAGLGIPNAGNYPLHVRFASRDKAYFLDSTEGRLIIWNPEEMSITGDITLPIESKDGLPFSFGEAMVLRDDGVLLLAVGWYDWMTQKGVDSIQLIAVDTKTDAILNTDITDECGDAYSTSLASDGTAYFSGYSTSLRIRQLLGAGYGSLPCQLRVVPPGGNWDDGYSVDLTALTGGLAAGEFLLIDDDTALIRVFDDSDLPQFREGDDINEYINSPNFSWWMWDLDEKSAAPIEGQEPGLSGGLRYRIDGKTYTTVSSEDWSETTLQEMGKGAIRDGITVRGYPYGVVRVR